MILGSGLLYSSQARVANFPIAYESDASAFVASEIDHADKVLNEYALAVFKVIPLIIAVCAVLIIVFDTPVWRAGLITMIAMMSVILLVDTNANARMEVYKEQLLLVQKQE